MSVVWITGASSGIGRSCALRYATSGASLILTSSSREKLEKVAQETLAAGSPQVKVLPYDFSDPEGVETLVATAWETFGGIDVAFLNAGISQRTTVMDTSMEMTRQIMEIDFFAPAAAARALVGRMVAAGGGSIAVTSSIAGLFGFPLRCAYSSAKHALYGYFETLRAENYDKGIRVTIVCPGRVRTDISLNALDKGGKKHGKMDPGQAGGLDPDKAAAKIIKAIRRGRREVLVGGKELAMVYVKRFFPGLCAFIGRKISPV